MTVYWLLPAAPKAGSLSVLWTQQPAPDAQYLLRTFEALLAEEETEAQGKQLAHEHAAER